MKDTKSMAGNFTLLHYLVNLLEEKKPDLLTWPEDVTDIKSSTKGMIDLSSSPVLLYIYNKYIAPFGIS